MEPVGLLRGQAGLKELGVWCRKGSLWRRHLQVRCCIPCPLLPLPSDGVGGGGNRSQLADGRYASIVEDYSASDTDGAWILWSGSLVLARCVEAHAVAAASSAAEVDGSVAVASSLVAVELGAGSGLVSVAAGGVGLAAVATEQDSGLPYLTANTDANRALFADSSGSCQVRRLHWGCAEDMRAVASVVRLAQGDSGTGRETPALLLGSDLTYLPAVMEPLASTLAQLAGPR